MRLVKRNQVEEDDDELGSLQYPEIVVVSSSYSFHDYFFILFESRSLYS